MLSQGIDTASCEDWGFLSVRTGILETSGGSDSKVCVARGVEKAKVIRVCTTGTGIDEVCYTTWVYNGCPQTWGLRISVG